MNSLYLEAYRFYKEQYAPNVILFHISSQFECYLDDAECLAQALAMPLCRRHYLPCLSFSDKSLEECVSLLLQADVPFTIVEYRAANGVYTIPKVKQILLDIESDY